MRLVDGLSEYDGRLEIRWNSEWRSICADGWNENDVIVVCRQLNYLSTSVEVEGMLVLYYTHTTCTGRRLHIVYYRYILYSIASCTKSIIHIIIIDLVY